MRRHYERTFRLCYAILRHEQDTRDVCQEVWLTIWKQMAEFRGEARFTTWLHPIAVRRALDHLRRRRRWYDRFISLRRSDDAGASDAIELLPDDSASPDPEPSETIAKVREALDALPAKHRAVLALRELEGLSYDGIAAAMKIPIGTVMSRIFHARRLLAKKLGAKS